jgi:hypothetical protein
MKKLGISLAIGFLMLVGATSAHAMTSCDFNLTPTTGTCMSDSNMIGFYYLDNGNYQMYQHADIGATLTLNPTTVPMLNYPTTYPYKIYDFTTECFASNHVSNTSDPDFCGTQANVITVTNGTFDQYTINHPSTPHVGIGMFKTGPGVYTATNMIGQTATAVQAYMGLNGLGSIVALIGGILVAFGVVLYIVNMFQEANDNKKRRRI